MAGTSASAPTAGRPEPMFAILLLVAGLVAIAVSGLAGGDGGAADAAAPTSQATSASEPAVASSGGEGSVHEAALELTVKGRAAKTGYERDEFGSGWIDVDRNGCDTRNDELQLRLTGLEMDGDCIVLAGDLDDPFTGESIHFERGGASEVDIDHLVALSDAWQKGAAQWEYAKRVAFANDPLNLEPVDASANREKGDSDAASWLPAQKSYRCTYVARQVAVKTKYEVWVTQAELDAMLAVLDSCPDQELPDLGDQPVTADNVGS
ncbi:HNH endonuclease family protein [Demequina sp. NBRC 110054]|uniref:HNH endonuclease family protein n=1 Tax=Demequina sp. NBRC 110054 TaxID=1570343 RepID=UPI00190EBC0C|nr:HNH endonuclease family protein [Demequina sp. NBRC 110054]